MREQRQEPDEAVDALRALGYEPRDVRVAPLARLIIWVFVLMSATAVVCYVLLLVLTPGGKGRELTPAGIAAALRQQAPAPRLQASPTQEMQDFRRNEDARLSAMEVADPQAGTARIPIGRAIDLATERGLLKARPANPRTEAER